MRDLWAGVRRVAAVLGTLAVPAAQAAAVASVSPQGGVAAPVRQVVVAFDVPVVALGDARQAAPVTIDCGAQAVRGSGRWVDGRRWVFDLGAPLPAGVACVVRRRGDFTPAGGDSLAGAAEFRFDTGAPAVLRTHPWQGSAVDEDAHFIVQLDGEVLESDLDRLAWCEVEGLAERLPLRRLAGAERDAVLAARRLQADAARAVVGHCGRPLPGGARVGLVWGAGIAARHEPRLRTRAEQRFEFRVRPAFTAEFSCERERANAPCVPVRPLELRFSAPVPRAQALAVRLRPEAGGAALAPSADADDAAELGGVRFNGPFAERAAFIVQVPAGLKDHAGRPLANAGSFPLTVRTADAPPLAKFAAAPFGIVEWTGEAALPITLRHVQGELQPGAPAGQVRVRRLQTDAEIIAWMRKLERWHERRITAREAGRPEREWHEWVNDSDDSGKPVRRRVERTIATRELPLLSADPAARRLALPAVTDASGKTVEVVGLPLAEPGYHVVEIESRRLGVALLDKPAPMYVRTGVLATNLGVHFKQGRENAAIWVTTLDRAAPVADAEVALSDCRGRPLWQGRTGADGLARVPRGVVPPPADCAPRGAGSAAGDAADAGDAGRIFVSARKTDGQGRVDLAFVVDGWVRGIEPWRFGHPTNLDPAPDLRAHTVFDRMLLRAGETVSMKHFVRRETSRGLAPMAADDKPTRARVIHVGSGDEFTLPLAWQGERSALSQWKIPAAAKLGSYRVELDDPQAPEARRRSRTSGEFRVEAFRVPLLDARLFPPRTEPVAAREVVLGAQLNWQAGGPVAGAALRGSAVLRPRAFEPAGWGDFSFDPPREPRSGDEEADDGGDGGRVVVDKKPLLTGADGSARFDVAPLPAITRPSELQAEITFDDPNGEQQAVSRSVALWPSAVVPGIRAAPSARQRDARWTVVVLDTAAKPQAGRPVEVRGRLHRVVSTRKRIVGGFYAYDNKRETRELGVLCTGTTDDRGLLACAGAVDAQGEVELVASTRDDAGRTAEAATRLWLARGTEAWFEQDNDDRIDVLPDRRTYQGGDTARLQVRMPFRQATVLVSVEREGILDTRVLTLRGTDPMIELPIDKAWGPNVYVSVLAVRGRVRHLPWTSFFDWGWRDPLDWARAWWYERGEHHPPTAMVDLSKPAFKLGVAALQVGLAAHELQVQVTPDATTYGVRGKARVKVQVSQGGQPAAGAEVAFAAVDEGLLALRDNDSWQLLAGLMRPRAWGVQTSTAASEIIGRRHYGRKAVPAGGGGGRAGVRELFDTLLLWQPRVALDARGEAVVEVPLVDALTSYRLVAVADSPEQRFGTGSAVIRVSQDLQILSGLPPQLREGDRFDAGFTLRNTTAREMKLRATLHAQARRALGAGPDFARQALEFPTQQISLPPGAARTLTWPAEVPAQAFSIAWRAEVVEQGGSAPASDRLEVTQWITPAVPLRVTQATLQPLDAPWSVPVAAPAGALVDAAGVPRGGVTVDLMPRLAGSGAGIRRFFETYPYRCVEQQASVAIGLGDAARWRAWADALPAALDGDGLASYFPAPAGEAARGSDRLTAYLLAVAHEAGLELPAPARERMLAGLAAFVEGRIERRFWAPRDDLGVRKLAAIEALSRHGRAEARQLGSIAITPQRWPTSALIDWRQILRRVDGVADAPRRLEEADRLLRGRLSWSGTTLGFADEAGDHWWWLMEGPDANAARLVLAVLDDPAWRDELPRLVRGALGRQSGGAWRTTTANVWGALALDRFGRAFEATPPGGRTQAVLGDARAGVDWARTPQGQRLELPWPRRPAPLELRHDGAGRPWVLVQAQAAMPLEAPSNAGYALQRTVTAVQRKDPSRWSRGDVLRVRLELQAADDRAWVVLTDPVPGGARVLGSGLARDSALATRGERRDGSAWLAYEERSAEAFRAYYEVLPRGRHVVEYTLRLDQSGRFALPPTRVEAMYAPEVHGELPNAAIEVAR